MQAGELVHALANRYSVDQGAQADWNDRATLGGGSSPGIRRPVGSRLHQLIFADSRQGVSAKSPVPRLDCRRAAVGIRVRVDATVWECHGGRFYQLFEREP